MKHIGLQLVYKKQVGFTLQQKESLSKLRVYGVNINQFISMDVKEKIKRDWKEIKESKNKEYCPF